MTVCMLSYMPTLGKWKRKCKNKHNYKMINSTESDLIKLKVLLFLIHSLIDSCLLLSSASPHKIYYDE